MLSLVVGASTHAFELMLAAFILGLALGGLWVRKRIDRYRDLAACACRRAGADGHRRDLNARTLRRDVRFDGVAAGRLRRGEGGLRRLQHRQPCVRACDHAAGHVPRRHDVSADHDGVVPRPRRRACDWLHVCGEHVRRRSSVSLSPFISRCRCSGSRGACCSAPASTSRWASRCSVLVRGRAVSGRRCRGALPVLSRLLVVALAVPVLPERMASGVYRSGRGQARRGSRGGLSSRWQDGIGHGHSLTGRHDDRDERQAGCGDRPRSDQADVRRAHNGDDRASPVSLQAGGKNRSGHRVRLGHDHRHAARLAHRRARGHDRDRAADGRRRAAFRRHRRARVHRSSQPHRHRRREVLLRAESACVTT